MRPPDPAEWEPDEALLLQGMRAFGAPAAEIERVQEALQAHKAQRAGDQPTPQTFGVWADNMPVVEAWCGISTQWRTAGMAGVMTGLDYAGVAAWLHTFIARRKHKEIMHGLQIMERAALAAMAQLRAQEQGE